MVRRVPGLKAQEPTSPCGKKCLRTLHGPVRGLLRREQREMFLREVFSATCCTDSFLLLDLSKIQKPSNRWGDAEGGRVTGVGQRDGGTHAPGKCRPALCFQAASSHCDFTPGMWLLLLHECE